MSYEMQPYSPQPIAEMGATPSLPFGLSLTQLALLGVSGFLAYKFVIKKKRTNPRRRKNARRRNSGGGCLRR